MNHFTSIVKKEVRELLTPATLVPIVVMAFVFGSMGNLIGGELDAAKERPVVGLVSVDGGTYGTLVATLVSDLATVRFNGTSPADIDAGIDEMQRVDGTAVFFVPATFSASIENGTRGYLQVYWIMQGAGVMDMVSSAVVESILQVVERNITERLIAEGPVNAKFALSPVAEKETTVFKDRVMADVSPAQIGNMLQSQSTTVPIIMMIIIIMAGGMVISSMGMEKENKTLETLLTLPVKRTSIVAGKIVGSAFVGLLMAVIYMMGFSYYVQSFQESASIDLADYGLALGATDYALIGLSVFFALLAALSLCMVLGTFAKNYKSAQTLTVPVSVLALIPMFVIMFKDFDTLPAALQAVLFAVPFSHPMMAMRALLFDNYTFVLAGIAYVALFACAMIAVAVWIFKTDKLLTGRIRRSPSSPSRLFPLLRLRR
jgi:ABC-2 type transport system permease protein